ncbi:hypothetical protein SETIT_7G127400v2 [Setaria italica]|uniref:Uncharacterized protein n=1 Tax=Setaria italica TaxID=4555 RepID=A0A368RV80_SETIT|nr:hypothetical protein SETIT_7G127400v2 [Setaria italica]
MEASDGFDSGRPSASVVLYLFFIFFTFLQEQFSDKAAIIVNADLASEHPAVPGPTLTEVEEVKMVAKLLPIWSTCILSWTVYSQMNAFTIEQASRMDRRVGGGGFVVPAGSTPVFLYLAILLFTSTNKPGGPELAPARCGGAGPHHARHGRVRARREEALRRVGRRRRRRHQRVLAGPAVLPGGRRRGVRVRRAAGVLHPGGRPPG